MNHTDNSFNHFRASTITRLETAKYSSDTQHVLVSVTIRTGLRMITCHFPESQQYERPQPYRVSRGLSAHGDSSPQSSLFPRPSFDKVQYYIADQMLAIRTTSIHATEYLTMIPEGRYLERLCASKEYSFTQIALLTLQVKLFL